MFSASVCQRTKADSQDYRYFPEADLPPVDTTGLLLEGVTVELPQQKRERFEKEYKLPNDYIEIFVSDLNRANYFEECIKLAPELVKQVADLMINKNLDKDFPEPAGLVKKLKEITSVEYAKPEEVESSVKKVISDNPEIVTSYKNGKGQVIGFLIGQTQKILLGKGDPKLITAQLTRMLNA